MKKTFYKIILCIIIVCTLFVLFLYINNDIGIASSKLENEIRKSQKIEESWTVDGSFTDTMASFISYSPDKSNYTFSVYVNRAGLSFGYFFRGGGSHINISEHIAAFSVDGYDERAFISMNSQNVQRVEIDDGNDIKIIDIDSSKPFAIVLPINAGIINFYDVNGNTVEYFKEPL